MATISVPSALRAECLLHFLHFSLIPSRLLEKGGVPASFSSLPEIEIGEGETLPLSVAELVISKLTAEFEVGQFSLKTPKILEYQGEALPLTKTQTLLLRSLICFYPEPADALTLSSFCFLPEKTPDPSAVRTHVSIINGRLREIYSSPLLLFQDNGYRINSEFLI